MGSEGKGSPFSALFLSFPPFFFFPFPLLPSSPLLSPPVSSFTLPPVAAVSVQTTSVDKGFKRKKKVLSRVEEMC